MDMAPPPCSRHGAPVASGSSASTVNRAIILIIVFIVVSRCALLFQHLETFILVRALSMIM